MRIEQSPPESDSYTEHSGKDSLAITQVSAVTFGTSGYQAAITGARVSYLPRIPPAKRMQLFGSQEAQDTYFRETDSCFLLTMRLIA